VDLGSANIRTESLEVIANAAEEAIDLRGKITRRGFLPSFGATTTIAGAREGDGAALGAGMLRALLFSPVASVESVTVGGRFVSGSGLAVVGERPTKGPFTTFRFSGKVSGTAEDLVSIVGVFRSVEDTSAGDSTTAVFSLEFF
jgi:hypothetical protein